MYKWSILVAYLYQKDTRFSNIDMHMQTYIHTVMKIMFCFVT